MKKSCYNSYGKSVILPTEEKLKAKVINKKVLLDKITVCAGDKNSSEIRFEIPCVVGGVNIASVPVYIKCENALGGKIKRKLQSIQSGDNLLIDWLLGSEETLVSGKLKCQISFETASGELVLNTETFELEIFASVNEIGPKATAEYNHITQMQNQLTQMFEAGLLPTATADNVCEVLTVNDKGEWQAQSLPTYQGENEDGAIFTTWKEVSLEELKTFVKKSENFGKVVKVVASFATNDFISGIAVVNATSLKLNKTVINEGCIYNYVWSISTATGIETGTCISLEIEQTPVTTATNTFSLANTHKFFVLN